MERLKYKKLWLALGWLWIVAIWYLSLAPNPPSVDMEHGDKFGHLLAYGGLMGWFAQIYLQRNARLFLMIVFIAMGVVLEILQGLTAYRMFDYGDMMVNALGVVLALVLARGSLSHVLLNVERRLVR